MTNKTTKRALFSSVVALFLCFAMLLGTTYAWFTDSVSSASNVITAGNLDVELKYAKVVDGKITDWDTVAGKDNIFDKNALWEPGRVEVVYLQVSNLGSLALKYQLGVNVYNETPATNMDGKEFKLSDHLVFTVVEMPDTLTTYTDREAATIASGSEKGLKDYNGKTTALEVGGVDYVALIVYMPETVGNEANFRGTAPSITLGINLFATQQSAEGDSFGDDYDKDAWVDGMKVYSAADLQAALNNGKDVVLMNDISADTIEVSGDVAINLNHKTLAANVAITEDATAVISNGKIVSASVDNSAIETVGNLTLNDVEVESARHAVRVEGGVTVINDGYYKAAGYAGRTQHALNVSDGGKVIVNGGTFVGPKGTASDSGSAVNVQAGSEVIINGGNFSGGKLKTLASKGTLTVYGGTFDQVPTAYLAAGYTTLDNGDGTYLVYFPQASFDALIDNAQAGATVEIPAGTYTFPASKLKEGMTLNCAPGTVFEGQTSLNIKGATVFGATFSNPTGSVIYSNTINGTFKNCTFTGSNALRYAYAGDTVVFEDCVFDGSVYGIHFDGGANNVTFKNCTISGFNTMGGAVKLASFEGCTFKSNGKSGYNGINLWGDTDMIDCTFVFDGSVRYEWVDLCNDNKVVNFTNCVVTDGETEKGVETVVGNYGDGNTVLVDGVSVVGTAADLSAALTANKKNIDVTLSADVDLPISSLGQITGGSGEYKLGGEETETIVIDLNGHKLNITTTYWSNLGAKNPNATFIIKNGTMTSSQPTGTWNSYDVTFSNCNYVFENVVFDKAVALANTGKSVTMTNVTINETHDYYALWICAEGQNVTIDGLTVNSNGRGIKIDEQYSNDAVAKVTLNVSNAKFNTVKKAAIMVKSAAGADIVLDNVDITNCAADNTNHVWVDADAAAYANLVTVTGGNVIVES